MSEAMSDLAEEVIAQLERLHTADLRRLHLTGGCAQVFKLGVKHHGARVMYALQRPAPPGNSSMQEEIFFELEDETEAVERFTALCHKHCGQWLPVYLKCGDEEMIRFVAHVPEGSEFNVIESSSGASLRRMLNIVKSAVGPLPTVQPPAGTP